MNQHGLDIDTSALAIRLVRMHGGDRHALLSALGITVTPRRRCADCECSPSPILVPMPHRPAVA